ncbi:hypothetical protein PQR14_11990 [Paraburkholderia bryophila]
MSIAIGMGSFGENGMQNRREPQGGDHGSTFNAEVEFSLRGHLDNDE